MMKRYFTWVLFAFPLIVIIPYFFPQFDDLTVYFRYMILLITLLNTAISVYFVTTSDKKDVRFFFSLFGASMLLYLLNNIFDIISIYRSYPSDIYDNLYAFIANMPILIFLLYRVIRDIRLLKPESRVILSFGAIAASSGFIIVGIVSARLGFERGVSLEDFLLYLPFLIQIIAIMVLSITLYIMYMELSFRNYILALLTGFIFSFIGETYGLFYGLYGTTNYRGIERIFTLLAFSYFFVILWWVRRRKITVTSISEIEEERKKYKALYLELDDKVRDLLILTQLLRHDLGNDIVVIANALDLYEERKTENLFSIARNRLLGMEERIKKLRSSSEIYESLKIQKIPISFVNDVTKLFENVTTKISNKSISIKGNQLVNFILFNLIQNSFKHGGDEIEVSVTVDEVDNFAILKVIDNGIGIPDEEKKQILRQVVTLEESEELPKGVGLSIAKTTIESLGGSFSIEDNEPQGTIIVMEIPKEE